MTITLTPETEARLRERAAREGQDISTLAEHLLADALAEDDPDNLTEAEVAEIQAGIRRGLEAAAAGRERSVEAYAADVKKRRAARAAGAAPERGAAPA